MSPQHQSFHALRRLLALKRHETPPPGYFDGFSSQVIRRIRNGDTADDGAFVGVFWEAPWLQRLWAALERKPILAGGFAAVVCTILVLGVVYSEGVPNGSNPTVASQGAASDSILLAGDRSLIEPAAVPGMPVSSTDGTLPQLPGGSPITGGSIFDELNKPGYQIQPQNTAAPGNP